MTTFWSAWIIILTAITLILTVWILFANRTRQQPGQTTGHVYDGIEEYDNPMPRWWFTMFMITIVFGVGYLVVYPGLGNFPGLLGWTQLQRYEKEMQTADAKYGPLFQRYADMPIEEVAKDVQAMKMASRIFANNCATCHGADARGAFGFPNLTDNDWLHGGEAAQIRQTITGGRTAAMPSWQAALGDDGVEAVAHYVLQLGGREGVDAQLAATGKEKFQMFCVACHGADGTGNPMLGAPNLTDDVWLYGGSLAGIKQTLVSGRNGQMPSFEQVLDSNRIHLMTAYVYSLSR